MALSKEEAKELAGLLKQIEKLSADLKKNINTTSLKDLEKNAGTIKSLFASLSQEWNEVTADISYAANGFKNIVQEITLQNQGIKESVKGYKGLASIADKLQSYQRGISDLSSKEIEKLKIKAKEEKLRLENAKDLLDTRRAELGVDIQRLINQRRIIGLSREEAFELKKLQKEHKQTLAAQANINGLVAEQDELYHGLTSTLKRVSEEVKGVDKLLGLGGAAAQGLSSALSGLGFTDLATKLGLDEANEKMKELAKEIQEAGGDANSFANKFKVLKAGIGSIGSSLIENLKDPLAISAFLVDQIISAFTVVDNETGKLAKNFGISYEAALGISDSLNTAANKSYLLNVTTAGLTEAFTELNNQFGTFANISTEALESYTRLTKEAGVTTEAAKALFSTTVLTGKEVEASTSEFLGQAAALAASKGLALNEKQILEDIQHISKATLLTLGGQPEELAKAVVESKALGASLEKVEAISSSLLQFEDSISAELEAELLTGKELNLEKARLAALNGDIATVASEIAKQTGTAADFTKMNVIQQEALAKSVGMTREDLAQSLLEREAMAKLSGVEGKTAKERFDNLVKEVGMEEAKKRLGDENLANMYAGQNVQERFAAAIEKLKEIFISIAEPLMPIVDAFAGIFKVIGPIVGGLGQMLKFLIPIAKYVGLIVIGYKALQFAGDMIYRRTILTNAAKKLGLITDKQAIAQAKITSMLGKDFIADETKKKLIKEKGLLITIKDNIQKKLGLSFDKQALLGQIKGAAIRAKDFLVEKATNAIIYARNIMKSVGNALGITGNAIAAAGNRKALAGLMRQAGQFVLGMFNAGTKAPFPANLILPFVLGGVAGALAAGLVAKFSKGDDVVSPGYGKRTLLSPEGAIALNDKDTVIAGTDLGGKKKGQPQQSSSPSINMQPVVERLMAVENVLMQILNKSSDVYMDSTKVGTALNIGSVQVQ
jgi:hypothetical protein